MSEAIIKNIDEAPEIIINELVSPESERGEDMKPVPMPTHLLKADEWKYLLKNLDFNTEIKPSLKRNVTEKEFIRMNITSKSEVLPFLNERQRGAIPLREIISVTQKEHYARQHGGVIG